MKPQWQKARVIESALRNNEGTTGKELWVKGPRLQTLIEWRKGEIEATDAIAHLGWEYVDKIGGLE